VGGSVDEWVGGNGGDRSSRGGISGLASPTKYTVSFFVSVDSVLRLRGCSST
jgi:hypothetical protein